MDNKRIFDLLDSYKTTFIKSDALVVKRNGHWEHFSSADYVDKATRFSLGLLAMGFKRGDKIATVSNNRPEWNMIDMGMLQVGVVHVPIYPTISEEEYQHILSHSEARIMIVSDKDLYNKIKPLQTKVPSLQAIYTFDQVSGAPNWDEMLSLGAENSGQYQQELETRKKEISTHDLASIIYTSGTTGLSKGVILTHDNIMSNVIACKPSLLPTIGAHSRILSFLPLCHIFERMINYFFQFHGVSIYYAENMDTIGDNIREIKPHGFATVPRMLEKVYDKIVTKGKNLTGIKKILFFWALRLGLKYEFNGRNGWWYELQLTVANKLIFSKWREALGGELDFIVSGGAALQPRLARVFWAARIRIQEGYGLTETSPVIAVNGHTWPALMFGTVGPIVAGLDVKIAEDGEILVKGSSVMKSYYKDPEKTSEAIDSNGYFHTGDIGELVDGKFLKITDRKKEIFKLSTGKYVAPQIVENVMKESMFVENVLVTGAGEKFASAIISPSQAYLLEWCGLHRIKVEDIIQAIAHPTVLKRIAEEVEKYNQKLGKTNQVKQFRLVPDNWTPETGELSPTLKLKRKVLKARYEALIEQIYREAGINNG